jgi:hypothetical protein
MAVSSKPWGNISQADYQDAAAYCKACLVDMNEGGADKTKDKCFLPVYEPGGDLNRNACASAVTYLPRTQIPPAEKKKAARKLASLYQNQLGVKREDLPPTLKNML